MKADINSLLADKLDGAIKVTSSRSKPIDLCFGPTVFIEGFVHFGIFAWLYNLVLGRRGS